MSSPSEKHLSAALRDLVADQPFTPDPAAIEHRARQDRRRRRINRGGLGAGAVAIAAVAAVVVSAAVPSGTARTDQAAPAAHPAKLAPSHAAVHPAGPADAQHTLVQLADVLAAAPQPKGDATLIERETSYPGQASINVWDLYADNGEYFFSRAKAGLPAQVSDNNNQGGGQFAREIAAATYAATGNLDTAALKMAWAPDTTPVPVWLKAQLKNISSGGLQIDNYVWEDCEDALIAGSGDPQVRAGVLRLVSVLPDITVTRATVDGQPALTITGGPGEFGTAAAGGGSPKATSGGPYQEAISINANTGIPLQFAGGPVGTTAVTVRYVVTRVSLADVKAGKF